MNQPKHIIARLLQSVFGYANGSGMGEEKIDKIQDLCDEILSIVNESLKNATVPDVISVDAERRDLRRMKHRDETKKPEHITSGFSVGEKSTAESVEPVAETEKFSGVAPAKRGRKKKNET